MDHRVKREPRRGRGVVPATEMGHLGRRASACVAAGTNVIARTATPATGLRHERDKLTVPGAGGTGTRGARHRDRRPRSGGRTWPWSSIRYSAGATAEPTTVMSATGLKVCTRVSIAGRS